MQPYRLGRLAEACRLPFHVLVVWFLVAGAARAADTVNGLVVDQSGRVIPRAFVRVIDGSGAESAAAFADEFGRFELPAPGAGGCRVEASLTGFEPAAVPCASSGRQPLRVVLAIAPVHEAIIVTATRTDAPSSQVGASVTVFTADDLERRQMPLIADLLRLSPGATVIRNGGPGAVTSLFVRGGESDYNKVLLDGVPLNEPGGNFYLNNLTTENLDRVEIVRGAFSSLFGSDAMASVVQLFTKRADRSSRPRGSAQFDGGTYDTQHMNASVSGAARSLDYSLGAARFSSDNRVPNSRLENTTLSANAGLALSETATLRFIARAELEHVGTPGATAFGRPDLDAFFERHDVMGGISFDQQLTSAFRQRASYSLAASNQASTNLQLDPSFTATFPGHTATFPSSDSLYDTRTNLRRHHASYQADWRISGSATKGHGSFPRAGEHLLTLLGDWDGERATLEDRRAASATTPSRDNFGASVQDQILWPRVFVTFGGRIERNENFGTKAVPRATIVYAARQTSGSIGDTRLKASVGTGIKEPSIQESFGLSFYAMGNPNLKPERSRSAEIGVEQRLANDRAKVDVVYFDNHFRDLIWTQTTDFSTYAGQYFNLVGLSRARGLELDLDTAPVRSLHARAGYTFLASEIVESLAQTVVFQKGAWAFRRPRHSGFVGARLDEGRVSVDISGVFIGRFVDNDFGLFDPPIVEVAAHTTWDARASLKLTSRVTGLLTIDNLTNRDYMEPIGYQPLQRTIRAGIRVGF